MAVWGSMYAANTFHNASPSKASAANAETTATLIKVILISRSTWSIPSRALAGYRLAHERLLAGFLFLNHFILLCLTRRSMEHRTD
jgi:hypothetical protein